MVGMLALTMLPDGSEERASRPGGRLAKQQMLTADDYLKQQGDESGGTG
jgi:hypothetical protein